MHVHGVRDGFPPLEKAARLEIGHDLRARILEGQALVAARQFVHHSLAVERDPGVQAVLLPPRDVGSVAERAAHDQTGPLLGVGLVVGVDGDLVSEERNGGLPPYQVAVALVVGMGEHAHARGQELRTRRRDQEVTPVDAERNVVEDGVVLGILYLGLRYCGVALRAPERRRLPAVNAALLVEVQERPLRYAL